MARDGTISEQGNTGGRPGLKLALVGALCLVLAGVLLWWREGGDVFARLVTTTLAWCF